MATAYSAVQYKSWTTLLLSFSKHDYGWCKCSVAEWIQKSGYNQLQRCDLFQLETNTSSKHHESSHATDTTRITTAGSIRQKFYLPKPQQKPQDVEGSLFVVLSSGKVPDLSWSWLDQIEEIVTRHTSQHTWGVFRFWQGKQVYYQKDIKAWKISSSEQ